MTDATTPETSSSVLDGRTLIGGVAGAALATTAGAARARQATPMASPVADTTAAGGHAAGRIEA